MTDLNTPMAWGVLLLVLAVLFTLDLVVSTRRTHAVAFREAVIWSVFYIAVAIAFGLGMLAFAGPELGAQYFAGYLVEKSLSVDNLFVFVIIMSAFAVPELYQQKLLTLGIMFALVLRAIFIAVGAAMLAAFSFMFLVFGAVLVWTGIALFRHRDEDPDIEDNLLVRTTKRIIPVTPGYREGHFFVTDKGRRMATPLFVALVAIGSTDVLFALDSIPAVFGVTQEAYIVFAANAFALLGLRALYFLVTGLLDRLVYLSTGLAAILVFIGAKLVLHWAHMHWAWVPEISTGASLVVIGVVLAVTTVASVIKVRRDPTAVAHAGTLVDQDSDPES